MNSQNNLCIIPARGGSKRIPRKNIKDFLGKPIIAYSIKAALESGLFSEVMISTDDEEIAEVGKKYGANVPFMRTEATANDIAPLKDVVNEVKEKYLKSGKVFRNICCLLATAPFVNKDILNQALQLMQTSGYDSVRPIIKFSYPIQRALRYADGAVTMFDPSHLFTRSQDLEAAYHDAGLFYWMDYDKGLDGTKKGGLIISENIAQDIDTPEDWEIAEWKYKYYTNHE